MRPPSSFPHPLPPEALLSFTHPDPHHQLFHPTTDDGGTTYAGNGHLALRITRGAWDADTFTPSPAALARFATLPWDKVATASNDPVQSYLWRPLDEIRHLLHTRHTLSIFAGNRLSPSPVVVLNSQPTLLSFIQLLARLPRAEFYLGQPNPAAPLYFRCTNGLAIVPPAKLHHASISAVYFAAPRDPLTGESLRRQPTSGRISLPLKNWPPQIDPDTPITPA